MFQRFILLATIAAFGIIHAHAHADDSKYLRDSLPQQWSYLPEKSIEVPDASDEWWRSFSDPLLNKLIAMGIDNNYNVAMALHRSEVARNTMNAARAGWYPSVAVNASWTKSRQSGATTLPVHAAQNVSYFSAGLSAQWEIDIFGKIASGVKAKKAAYMASKAEYAGAMVSMCAQIAAAYVELREYQQELEVARNHAERQMKIVNIAKARFETTLASKLDVAQALETYYSTTASIPMLENSVHLAINSIAVLTGMELGEAQHLLSAPGVLPDYNQLVSTGVPADLLRRRPDIAQAEMELAEYAANIGIAKKDFLPTLTIEGTIGTDAHKLGDLFSKNSFTYSVVPTLSWTIFEGFSRKYSLAAARETMQIGIENYNLTVSTAVQEADNAISTYHFSVLYTEAMRKVIEQNDEELQLAIDRYKNSLSPMSDVVNAQLRSLAAENTLISAESQALSALIKLYEALGGGFNISQLK